MKSSIKDILLIISDLESALHTIKINQAVQLSILPNFEDYQEVLFGIYHSHPEYVDKIIVGVDKDQRPTPNNTPFTLLNLDDVIYRDFEIPFMNIKIKGAIASINKGIDKISMKFHLTSSSPESKFIFSLT